MPSLSAPTPSPAASVELVDFSSSDPAHAAAFAALNRAWITRYFALEAEDRRVLDDPVGQIIRPGGAIVVALVDDRIVGTCALIAEPDGVYELAKMAVDPQAHGRGIGRALGEAVIIRARRLGGRRVELLSNSALMPALALYTALGFRHVPVPATPYQRTDVKMVLDL